MNPVKAPAILSLGTALPKYQITQEQAADWLANSLRGMGVGAHEPVFDRLDEIRTPTLLLAGAEDERYCALARRTAAALPCARLQTVPEAGHAIHLEQRKALARAVREFLEKCLPEEEEKERVPCQ